MKWVKIAVGRYACGEWSVRQAMWRRTPDGWMIFRGDVQVDSRRRFSDAKKTAERLMVATDAPTTIVHGATR
jgi:hypothetical protein